MSGKQHIQQKLYKLNNYSKLNLACGPKIKNKFKLPWLNVDIDGKAADYICDIMAFPKEWNGHFEEVRASHVLEHIFLDDVPKVLSEWIRVLKPNGVLRIIVPDLDIVLNSLNKGFDEKKRKSLSIDTTTPVLTQIYGWGYGSKNTKKEWRHRMIYNKKLIIKILKNQKTLKNIKIYKQNQDPAFLFKIKDDSQNIFSICVQAEKK